MKGKLRGDPGTSGGIIIQFNLVGLILFTIALVVLAGFLAYGLAHAHPGAARDADALRATNAPGRTDAPADDVPPRAVPAWGELLSSDIELEPPEEYLAFDLSKAWVTRWAFDGRSTD